MWLDFSITEVNNMENKFLFIQWIFFLLLQLSGLVEEENLHDNKELYILFLV